MNKKAFSLIELIFVISILGIIASVAVPKLMDSRSGAIVTTIKQDITTISTAIESYYMLNNGISKIENSVHINKTVWKVSDKKIEYLTDDNTNLCLSLAVTNNKLVLNIDENSQNKICQKLLSSGVVDFSHDLL